MRKRERWRVVEGFKQYEISDWGRVRRVLKPFKTKSRHLIVCLYRGDGRRKTIGVHVLVARAFKGPRPKGKVVHHRDDNPGNNRDRNLRYVTYSQNTRFAIRSGRMTPPQTPRRLNKRRADLLRKMYYAGASIASLEKEFGIRHQAMLRTYMRGMRRRSHGWKLTTQARSEILCRYRFRQITVKMLAKEYGVSPGYVQQLLIKNR